MPPKKEITPYIKKQIKLVHIPLKEDVPVKYLDTTRYEFVGIGPSKSRQEFRIFKEFKLLPNPAYTKIMMNKATANIQTLKTNNIKLTAKYSLGKTNTRKVSKLRSNTLRQERMKTLRKNMNNNNNNNNNYNNNYNNNNNKNNNMNYNERTEYARSLITGLPSANLKKLKELRNKTKKNVDELSKLLNKIQ